MQVARLFKVMGLWWCQMVDEPTLMGSGNDIFNAVHNLNTKLDTVGRPVLPYPYIDSLVPRDV